MYLCLDIGGTNLRIGMVENRRIVNSKIVPSSIIISSDDPLGCLEDVLSEYINEVGNVSLEGISIGLASSVEKDQRTVICTTNLKNSKGETIFNNIDLATPLEKVFNVPVVINNDTDNIIWHDINVNLLEDAPLVIGIYVGTGIGSAVVINGKNLTGANGAALDLGHVPYYKGDEICSCKKKGCCEAYASGWRLEKICQESFPDTDIKEIFLKHSKEPVIREFLYSMAHIFSVMATIFNPSAIIAGGGVIEMEGFPKDEFNQMIFDGTGLDVMQYGYRIIYSSPQKEKGLIGGAIFAEKYLGKK